MSKLIILFIIAIAAFLLYHFIRGASILNQKADEIYEEEYRNVTQGENNGSKD